MKKITLIFSLLVAMFTTAMAQETVDLTTGTFDGIPGEKDRYSQWTSTNGVTIVSTDGNSDTEIATMKYYNGFRLDITNQVSDKSQVGTRYTITVPEGYVVTKMTIKNGGRGYETHVDCGYESKPLPKDNADYKNEVEVIFPDGENFFYLRGPEGRYIYITSLTITKVGGDNNQGGEGEGEVEGGDNNQGGEGEGEVEGGDNNQGGEGEGEVEGGDNNQGGEGEGEGGDNETSINEVKVENAQVIYDITGRRVNEITKAGIYVINGKKVIK